MSKLQNALLVLALGLSSTTARAEDAAVSQRLSSNGGLSAGAAKKLANKVSQRMNKSADTTASANDPLRIAMSQALFHTAMPPDTMSAAKMRLKLYAGLNEANLEALFAPKPGAIASCTRATGATQGECEALVAAAGRTSVAQARTAAGGPAVAVAVVGPTRAQPAPAGGSHFGHFDSGFKGAATAAPAAAAQPTFASARPQPAAGFGARPAPAQNGFGARPAVAQNNAQSQKEAYRAQREAYLARQKAQFEERKQKLDAATASASAEGPSGSVSNNAAATRPAAAAKAPPPSAASTKPGKAEVAAAEAPAAEPAEEAPAQAKNDKPALDEDFLGGLLSDPLGKK